MRSSHGTCPIRSAFVSVAGEGDFMRELDTSCPFLYPCSPEKLKLETIELIGNHFIAKKIGWFNEYHFLKVAGPKLKYKAFWAVWIDQPIRLLDLCLISLFSTRHPDQSVPCI